MLALFYYLFGLFRATILRSLFACLRICFDYRAVVRLGVMEFHALLEYLGLLSVLG